MDHKDRLLISLLKLDARRSIVALARDLGLSRSATQERLAKLVSNGSIAGFTIVEGTNSTDQQTAHLLIRLQKGNICSNVVPRLRAVSVASSIHSVAGNQDILMRLDAASIGEIEAARARVAAVPGIAEITTFVTLERHR